VSYVLDPQTCNNSHTPRYPFRRSSVRADHWREMWKLIKQTMGIHSVLNSVRMIDHGNWKSEWFLAYLTTCFQIHILCSIALSDQCGWRIRKEWKTVVMANLCYCPNNFLGRARFSSVGTDTLYRELTNSNPRPMQDGAKVLVIKLLLFYTSNDIPSPPWCRSKSVQLTGFFVQSVCTERRRNIYD
jgi:hypothetical protein